MKKRDKYIKAAEYVCESKVDGQPEYACLAMIDAGFSNTVNFEKYFKPRKYTGAWFGNRFDPENQLARSLALLFMAELDK